MWNHTNQPAGLLTDLYHVDSAFISWKTDRNGLATFDLYTRAAPFGGAWMLVAGLELAAQFATAFRYTDSEIAWLKTVRPYPAAFYDDLRRTRFTGEILAMAEGEIAFPGEPLARVTASFREALLLESGLLHTIGISTLLATKAARVVLAAGTKPVSEFAFRRAQEPWLATRSAWIAGTSSTSFLAAAEAYGIPVSGTIPHALIQAYPSEREAFLAVAECHVDYTLLLDTYDVRRSVHLAIETAHQSVERWGHRLTAVRLDSGDIDADARFCREQFDGAGLTDTLVLASGDLDEYGIAELERLGSPIDGYGVGTSLGVGAGSLEHGVEGGALGAVYKLVWYDADRDGFAASEEAPIKIAGAKSTWPGKKQISRCGSFEQDIIHLDDEAQDADCRPLLQPVVRHGHIIPNALPTLKQIRERARQSLTDLPEKYHALQNPPRYPLINSPDLVALRLAALNRKTGPTSHQPE
jgi:nicotinate phosphoribosyltransferase